MMIYSNGKFVDSQDKKLIFHHGFLYEDGVIVKDRVVKTPLLYSGVLNMKKNHSLNL
ncbi:MAG: hypothetical protein GX434_15785 [Peptococcaceae bacterium]|nr:hypothetical protein [Peptococcaceae bacterium]